jgi:hypothetical protein
VRFHDETGGVFAKILGLLVVLAVLAGAALYLYGKQQQPLSFDGVHVATSDHLRDPSSVAVTRGTEIFVATIVHNDGRLPITLQGLSEATAGKTDPYVPVSMALGDGRTPDPATEGFTPPSLDPGNGIGIVITFQLNPSLACSRFTDTPGGPLPLPPVGLRFASYGVETTQSVPLGKGAPTVEGPTRARCEAAMSA